MAAEGDEGSAPWGDTHRWQYEDTCQRTPQSQYTPAYVSIRQHTSAYGTKIAAEGDEGSAPWGGETHMYGSMRTHIRQYEDTYQAV